MLSHEWLTPDRAVQRTCFSDGTEAVVNFGVKPHAISLGAKNHLLPQNGFAVKGPKIEQSLVLDGQRPVTTIRTADYLFSDAHGAALAMRREGNERVKIQLGTGKEPAVLALAQFVPGWDVATTRLYQLDAPFLSKLMLSSQATGWTDEPGTVERCQVIATGPARTLIAVRKALHAGVVYEKTYAFYSQRFDVTASVNKHSGTLSRAYYLQPGQYVDNAGNRAAVDGQGDDEGVMGKNPKPLWYAVYADRWAHSCVGLSQFHGMTYWDAGGSWGGIGLDTAALKGVRMSYVVHHGAQDARFAEEDYRQLTTPPHARWE